MILITSLRITFFQSLAELIPVFLTTTATYSTYTWEWSAVYLSQHISTGLCLFSSVCAFWWMFLMATVMVYLGLHCTFEVGSDAGIISWCLPHELVQEVGRRQLWPCPDGGLYLLLTGAQSDITQGRRESGNKIQRERREDFGNSSSGVGMEKNNENPIEWEANRYHQVSHQQKNTQRQMGKWGWKMMTEWLASACN